MVSKFSTLLFLKLYAQNCMHKTTPNTAIVCCYAALKKFEYKKWISVFILHNNISDDVGCTTLLVLQQLFNDIITYLLLSTASYALKKNTGLIFHIFMY